MEEGHFSLNDLLAKHIPELANLKVQDGLNPDGSIRTRAPARQPTMHDVLRHTTGWTGTVLDLFPDPVSQKLAKGELKRPANLGKLVTALASEPLAYDPGAEWRYGPEHDLQAYLIEKFSGLKLADFLRIRIFEPLGMIDTGFSLPQEKLARYPVMYAKKPDGSWTIFDPRQDSTYLADARDPRGGTGLTSTAADQMRFGQMLLNGGELDGKRILGRKTVDMMLMDQLPAAVRGVAFGRNIVSAGKRYGLGIGLYTDVAASGLIGSEGVAYWGGFSHTVMFIDRDEGMLILAMSQHQPADHAWEDRVRSLAYQAVVD
jgi:CubicO group peptidase (beta-lactamase class C family)